MDGPTVIDLFLSNNNLQYFCLRSAASACSRGEFSLMLFPSSSLQTTSPRSPSAQETVLPRAPYGQALSLLFIQGFLRARALVERLLVEHVLLKPRVCLDRRQHLRLLRLRRLRC